MNMRLLNIFLIISAVVFATACSNGEASTNAKTEPTATEAKGGVKPVVEDVAPAKGEVVYLKTNMFIDQIFDYKTHTKKWVYKGDKPAIIDFYTDWCGPCKRVAPIMEELAAEYDGQIRIYKMNTEKEPEVAGVFGIRSIPSILFIPVNGQPTMYTGAYPKQHYIDLINENLLKK
jgi:thioredoxin